VRVKDKLLQASARVDLWLKRVIGAENELLYHFARLLLVAIVLAVLVGLVVWIVAAVFHAVSVVFWAFVAVAPYLFAVAILVGGAMFAITAYRKKARKPPEPESQNAMPGRSAPRNPPNAHEEAGGDGIQQSLLAADRETRSGVESVLATLQRFDHRLQLVISPAHYIDLFGDNWAAVRQFVESPQGRSVTDVSAALVEIVILYKRAQDVRWVPINHDRIHAWWGEAARRRKYLSDASEAAAHGDDSNVPKSEPLPQSSIAPQQFPRTGTPPHLSAPPTLDDLLRYYEWTNPAKK
jgi:hypothetical protein